MFLGLRVLWGVVFFFFCDLVVLEFFLINFVFFVFNNLEFLVLIRLEFGFVFLEEENVVLNIKFCIGLGLEKVCLIFFMSNKIFFDLLGFFDEIEEDMVVVEVILFDEVDVFS